MCKQKIEKYIKEELPQDNHKIALEFVEFLKNNELEFVKDNGYWKNKIYYLIKFNAKCVCFIAINDPDEKDIYWTVWSDDIDSEWLKENQIENELKETAWKNIDFCGSCGSCGGGRHKVIFGRDFKNVCSCTFRFDNPDAGDLPFMKKMVQIRKNEILNSTKKV